MLISFRVWWCSRCLSAPAGRAFSARARGIACLPQMRKVPAEKKTWGTSYNYFERKSPPSQQYYGRESICVANAHEATSDTLYISPRQILLSAKIAPPRFFLFF